MLVRYGKMGLLGSFRHAEREIPPTDQYVVVHTERGLEIGQMVCPFYHRRGQCSIPKEKIDSYFEKSGPNYPFTSQGRFVRYANDQDLNEQRHLDKNAREEANYCRDLIEKHKLPMHLVSVEHLFGGDRIIYYFMAEGRVDFRDLVKELAQQYQTRIEMRQIGARDEARLVGDYETCGRQCCCKNFLKVLQPVNMRMAKLQKATLDPTKISGRCGRLKCCLRYEDEVYTELNKKLPRSNSWVRTEQGIGQVLETQVITQLVKMRLESGKIIAISVEEILERNLQQPSPVEQQTFREKTQRQELKKTNGVGELAQRDNDQSRRDQQGEQSKEQSQEQLKEKSGDQSGNQQNNQPDNQSGAQSGGQSSDQSGEQPRKKRRRRRKKKKRSGGGDSQSPGRSGNGNSASGGEGN
ncbi:MAG: hypothetical protein JXD22_10510 [Sedimentisphaerales bacterium]|nr:hypothetical protein [Sedimentisphaerales bacterium]